ncbi:4-hydroxybenzoate 3-monooxygenase [Pseudovibrio exalbescens]|uniref:4-hydroxybenzoate 3-monooxygenase n=1 Tax=Pseudovibrio exalbescens TaxID=197461 RepID=UPI00236693ED|nr:4-hydroxybenzoate 3-monooxygenase [Pseudovibrio exalbescens]MDD7909262.1 4-hydroxybenzoate 3-monooxygenase [Pseudovibrio exalbescens]
MGAKHFTTQVAIIGGGPAGLLLSHILQKHGIESIVLERQTKDYVLARIRAGFLEHGTVQMLRDYDLGERMDREGLPKNGGAIACQGKPGVYIDTVKWTGKQMMAYGQTAITEDLYAARERDGGHVINEAGQVALHDLKSDRPRVTFSKDGENYEIACSFIAGCDGFHGVSRQSIPSDVLKVFERAYPFGWLGIMAEVPPLKELVYAYHEDGFALASQRNPMLSRYYVQCDINDAIEDWTDDRFWEALLRRMPDDIAGKITTGPSIEKSIAPLRSFVAEPMQYGALFLAGDAAHIVPPTGAKGLNLAFSDVHYLSRGLIEHLKHNRSHHLERYSADALRRVWSAENFSWRMTKMLHAFPNEDPFTRRIQANTYDLLLQHPPMQQALAYEYVGLPF